MAKVTISFDGACEPKNPGGNMAWAIHCEVDGKCTLKGSGFQKEAPQNSNNLAEYLGFRMALDHARAFPNDEITIQGDSKLVICQMRGEWKINGGRYIRIAEESAERVQRSIEEGYKIELKWIPRAENEKADAGTKHRMRSHGIKMTDWTKKK